MPELKIGDYVDERGRIGQVSALHTKGTADIQFEDLDYPIRRQVRNLRKVELNPKRGGVLYEVYDPHERSSMLKFKPFTRASLKNM